MWRAAMLAIALFFSAGCAAAAEHPPALASGTASPGAFALVQRGSEAAEWDVLGFIPLPKAMFGKRLVM